MFKPIKHFFNDKPWKCVTTRKLSFMYVLLCGTIVIAYGGFLLWEGKGIDSSTWLTETFSFLKWMLTTGVVVVLTSATTKTIQTLKGQNNDDGIINDDGDE